MISYFTFIYGVIIISLVVIAYLVKYTFAQDKGTDDMQKISNYIEEGAMAFIKRQYKTIAALSIVTLIIIVICNYFGNSSKGSGTSLSLSLRIGIAFYNWCILLCTIWLYWNVYGCKFKHKSCCWSKKRLK